MEISIFIEKLASKPEEVTFAETMEVIAEHYSFEPVSFTNGNLINEVGQNLGSCKLFSFAKIHGFTEAETLACFGTYYHIDVLNNPRGTDHQNIRNFMKTGWDAISFEKNALTKR